MIKRHLLEVARNVQVGKINPGQDQVNRHGLSYCIEHHDLLMPKVHVRPDCTVLDFIPANLTSASSSQADLNIGQPSASVALGRLHFLPNLAYSPLLQG